MHVERNCTYVLHALISKSTARQYDNLQLCVGLECKQTYLEIEFNGLHLPLYEKLRVEGNSSLVYNSIRMMQELLRVFTHI